jgi:hypothetical protein
LACDADCFAAVTNRLAVRDRFVISALDTAARAVHFIGETAMIINTQHPDHAAEWEVSRLLLGRLPDDGLEDDLASDVAEVHRMIQLSGMISLECGLLEGE